MKPDEMFDQIKQVIEGRGFNISESHFLIGVSGGVDSMCLLDVLSRRSCRITVAHYNHLIRSDAGKDEVLVRNSSETLGIPYVFGHGDVAKYAKKNGLSFEEAARLLRYQFLFDTARQEGCDAVVVAHNADDQVETIMMHLLRGSGMAGLKGMKVFGYLPFFAKDIPILRPLLGIWREEIEEYQQLHQIEFREDYTNIDTTFFRNRIRHELLPLLTTYNPNFKLAAWRMGDNLRSDFSIVEAQRQSDWEVCIIDQQESFLIFALDRIKALPEARVRNLLRSVITILQLDVRDFGFERMKGLIRFVQFPSESRTYELFSEYRCFIYNDKLFLGVDEKILQFLQKQYPQMSLTEQMIEKWDLRIDLNEVWYLTVELLEFGGQLWKEIKCGSDSDAWIDISTLNWPLRLRPVISGDRFTPFGMNGHQIKVSDYFINEGIPRKIRGRMPLLVSNGEIVWVVGKRLSEKFRVRETTKELIHFCLKHKEE
ncbi:MAG: tRNA lysidine(34) synthetase TilS [Anaerolineaceae bacterium]|nr:tRNA lysidine(34) synthetase TilS [Anaerolineaceae bacterium]